MAKLYLLSLASLFLNVLFEELMSRIPKNSLFVMLFPETVLFEEPESEMPYWLFVMLFPETVLFEE